jgi:hypothetical protein
MLIDLIDFQSTPAIDHNSVEMWWLIVVKDHFGKLV